HARTRREGAPPREADEDRNSRPPGEPSGIRADVARSRSERAEAAMTRPPRACEALLNRCLPADVRDDVTGDLGERYGRDVVSRGERRARWRYCRSALAFSARF